MKKYNLSQAKKNLPTRSRSDNKTKGGKCLVVAGSKGYWGAAVLVARAAARAGAGYVYLADQDSAPKILLRSPDFLSLQKKDKVSSGDFNAVAVGPGLNSKNYIKFWIKKLLKINQQKVVLDAGSFDAILKFKKKFPPSWILTPHEGEMGRLLGVSSDLIRKDRVKYIKLAQAKYGGIFILKGFHTLVTDGKTLTQIQSGNPALAKAGTGDVLCGIVLALLSQGIEPVQAACLGAFIHGFIADHWIKEKNDQLSLMASDLIDRLPKSLFKIRN